jgi:hypothetical protein
VDELFSCRNCVHNAGQSLNIGRGAGYCIKHQSMVLEPSTTTCKYLHRKDLPSFVVDEGLREHAAEFAGFSALADLCTRRPIQRQFYSERYAWEHRAFDPLTHSLAQYHKTRPSWVFVQSLSGGLDGRRSLAHSGLVRRYMDKCGTWRSSYRLVLALLVELPVKPNFSDTDLNSDDPAVDDTGNEALWDVVFARLACIQEYGFHSGIETLMWATDALNGGLSELNWMALSKELAECQPTWTGLVVQHASNEGMFFPKPDQSFDAEDDTEVD